MLLIRNILFALIVPCFRCILLFCFLRQLKLLFRSLVISGAGGEVPKSFVDDLLASVSGKCDKNAWCMRTKGISKHICCVRVLLRNSTCHANGRVDWILQLVRCRNKLILKFVTRDSSADSYIQLLRTVSNVRVVPQI